MMTEDEQEAESRKYGAVAMVLRLESGNFAVFGPGRKLYMIVRWMDIDSVLLSETFWSWCKEQNREYKPARSPAMRAEDIIDVGDVEI
jgi:hypothetical protein